MTAAFLRIDAHPHLPARPRAMATMAALGLLTGLISCVPSPLPDIRWDDPEILINARTIPLHAGIAFGAMLAGVTWLWLDAGPAQMLAGLRLRAGRLAGWGQHRERGVFDHRELGPVRHLAGREGQSWVLRGLLLGGLAGGAAGSGLVTFGLGFATPSIRRMQTALPIVATGTAHPVALLTRPPISTSCRSCSFLGRRWLPPPLPTP